MSLVLRFLEDIDSSQEITKSQAEALFPGSYDKLGRLEAKDPFARGIKQSLDTGEASFYINDDENLVVSFVDFEDDDCHTGYFLGWEWIRTRQEWLDYNEDPNA